MSKWQTKEYRCWQNIKDRCLNPNHKYFEKYSKLGMQESWQSSFDTFIAHIGPQPCSEKTWTVGRIDNDVGYFEGNVRWEDGFQQNRNRGKPKSNKTGTTGVTWREEENRPFGRAIATWYGLDGKQKSKSFSEEFGGKEAAIKSASEHRTEQIKILNERGAGYAEKHGK